MCIIEVAGRGSGGDAGWWTLTVEKKEFSFGRDEKLFFFPGGGGKGR